MHMRRISRRALLLAVALITAAHDLSAQGAAPLYENTLEKLSPGKLPEEFMVLDGQFVIKAEGTNHVIELPGAPLETFGVLFGPTEKDNVSVSARFLGTGKGRRFPVVGLSLNGVSGCKLQVVPAKRVVELVRGDTVKASAAFEWQSGKWTTLSLTVRKADAGAKIEASAWTEGAVPPATPLIVFEEKEPLAAGRAAFWGMPFAGTPIWFDDLKVMRP